MKKILVPLVALAMMLAFAPAASAVTERPTITGIVAASGGEFDNKGADFDILLTAVLAAGLEGALADEAASLTVFAPNDRAFIRTARDLGFEGTDEEGAWNFLVAAFTELGNGDPIPVLTNVLLYHVAPEKLGPIQVIFGGPIDTLLEGATVQPRFLSLIDNDPDIKNPRLNLRRMNIQASNGVIHVINRVLIPINL
jgi:uncharacterized surface protein with fasciclin (FAS1) repeats